MKLSMSKWAGSKWLGVMLFVVNGVWAEEVPTQIAAVTEPTAQQSGAQQGGVRTSLEGSSPEYSYETRGKRSFALGADLSTADLIVPMKIGATVSYIQDADTTYEVNYLRGTIDDGFLGFNIFDLTDQRISLLRRSFFGNNSFNLHYGLTYFDFKARLHIPNSTLPSEFYRLKGFGANIGLGNRWMAAENFSIGIDWISWHQPIVAKEEFPMAQAAGADTSDVDLIKYFPRLVFFHLQAAVCF